MIKMASATPMALRLVRLLALAGGAGAITVNGVPLGGVAPAPPQAGLTLQLEGVGNLTVLSGEEPALAVDLDSSCRGESALDRRRVEPPPRVDLPCRVRLLAPRRAIYCGADARAAGIQRLRSQSNGLPQLPRAQICPQILRH